MENLRRFSPSEDGALGLATGRFYLDKKEHRWGLRLGGEAFYPLTFQVNAKDRIASLEYRLEKRCFLWTSEGQLKACP
jgi:hypothetical protein